ncbi:MAG: hypothetical protein JW956_11930 [Calditrichaceae bacterium]|nr:hypothetical protein [Calditrichaceae bacterium]
MILFWINDEIYDIFENMAQIYVYSGPTHSGKTTRLENWIKKNEGVDGILMPVINNQRYVKSISSGKMLKLETDSNDHDLVQIIGKYKFRSEVFEHIQHYLLGLIDKNVKWIIVDEIGFLELNDQGFEPAVSQLIQKLETKQDVNLLLVIRDYLKEKVIDYYKLNGDSIKNFKPE